MSQGRHGIKVLGLSLLAALGLMAFTAAAAQAGEYTIEGSSFTSKGVTSESVAGSVGEGRLLVPGLGIAFKCTGGTASGTVLLGGVAHASILYTGCTTEGNKFCKIFETKARMETNTEPGSISASGLGSLVSMAGSHYLLVESASFATLYLTPSTSGCTLPLENAVNGSTVLSAPTALTPSVNQALNTIPQATLESLWASDVLKYGNQPSWLDEGSATAHLEGVNKGKTWGAE